MSESAKNLAAQLLKNSPSTCDAIYELARAVRALAVETDCELQAELSEKLFELASDNREAEEETM